MRRKKMAWWKFKFNPGGTLIYLQNNSSWYGDHISSTVLSCDIGIEEAMDRMKKLEKYLGKKADKPVKWSDVLKRSALFEDSYKDEQAGDLVRDDCKEVSNVDMYGGFLFGGGDGMKYVNKPKIDKREDEDVAVKWSRPIAVLNCSYEGGHKCSTSSGRDSIERLKMMQKTVQDLFLLSEFRKWKKEPSSKAKSVLAEIESMMGDAQKGENLSTDHLSQA